jgi:hypothetical protein
MSQPRPRCCNKKRELLRREDFDEAIDSVAGIELTHLSGMAARCSNDLATRHKIDSVVLEICKEMAKAALAMADKNGEPPLDNVRRSLI